MRRRALPGGLGAGSAPTVAKAVACLAQRDLFAPCYEELAAFLRAVPAAAGAADAVEELLGQYSRLTHQWRALVEEQERRLTEEVVQARGALERAEGAAETLLRVAERLEQENAELSARAAQGAGGGARPRASPTPSPAPAPAPATTPAPTPPTPFFFGDGVDRGSPGQILASQEVSCPLSLQQWREVLWDLQRFISRPERPITPRGGASPARRSNGGGRSPGGAAADPRPARARGTDRGLEKWVEAYLRVRFGPNKERVQEWKQLLLGAAQAFAPAEPEAAVFLKSWDGTLECTFYTKLRKAGRAFDRIVQQHWASSRGFDESAPVPARLARSELENLLGRLVRPGDREMVARLCGVTPATESVDSRVLRHAFLSVLVEGHEKNLRPVERAWRLADRKRAGSLGHAGFAKFCRNLKADMSRGEVAALVQMLDPASSGKISYERCLHNFSAELWSLDGTGGFLRGGSIPPGGRRAGPA